AHTEETGLDPWIMSETPEPPQIEKTDNCLSQDCVIKIFQVSEEKSSIHEANIEWILKNFRSLQRQRKIGVLRDASVLTWRVIYTSTVVE
ncbi:4072_t:CDS:2, partial [Acaulospora colombiana]